MRVATTPPWHGEAVVPTPAGWVDWFLSNGRDGQLEIAEWAIRFGEEANDCFIKHGRFR